MSSANSHLQTRDASNVFRSTSSLVPSGPPSADGSQSQDPLLSGTPSGADDQVRQVGDNVASAPHRVERAVAENPTHATNLQLASFEAKVIRRPVTDENKEFDDLNFWPVILKRQSIILLVLLYVTTAVAIGVLMWKSKQNSSHNFRLSSDNVHMISRYFPSIVGTVTVLLFRQTIREALRMMPFVSMADQNGLLSPGSEPWKGVGGAWFPWQSFTTTPKRWISVFSLFCQLIVSFIVSLKVALFASEQYVDATTNQPYWILTVRVYPAIALIGGYTMMIVYTLYIAWKFRGKSTGLKWDPVSIADYCSLFSQCNALEYFSPLELRHDLRPKHVMLPDRRFRLGYWTKAIGNPSGSEVETVYGIGVGFSATHRDTGNSGRSQQERDPLGRPLSYRLICRQVKKELLPVDECPFNQDRGCAEGTWPNCEHYPYRHSPGCPRWLITLFSLLPIGVLTLGIYAWVIGLPYRGFSFPNNLKVPSDFHYGFGSSNHTLPPIDPADPKSTVLLWALMFRSLPTYLAGMFSSTIITWIDLNMRFMQPFRNMFGEDLPGTKKSIWRRMKDWFGVQSSADPAQAPEKVPATAAESILLAYITVSPFQVPLTAFNNSHYKVCIYSTLNTLSPVFPIFVGGLLTVSPNETYDRVNFSFSLSAYIGIMVSVLLYSILLPAAIPAAYRLLPRQLYSLADLMAMCHQSKFMASPHLNITKKDRTPTKQHMEARLLLTDDRFLFGVYNGRDGHNHIGFDVTKKREPDFGELRDVRDPVQHLPPEGFASMVQRTARNITEQGKATGRMVSSSWKRSPRYQLSQQTRGVVGTNTEMAAMSGGLGQQPAT